MGKLWDIVQAHIDSSPYPPSERQVAARLGISPTALSKWKAPRKLPDAENLHALAHLAGLSYDVVLDAVLEDIGYKGDPGAGGSERVTLTDSEPDPVNPADHVLAARDVDDDDEAEAQQGEA